MVTLCNMGFLSPDGRSYSFDQRANGYGRGEGIAVVVIKLLADAVKDGDTIRAVIRSTGTNQDGRTPGVTQPSKDAQESLIRHVYNKANLDFSTTRYIEGHGPGTPLGDPIEVSSIGAVFARQRTEAEPLVVGSVKSNIGHLEAASGLAGLIKTVLVLERGLIPPIADFQQPNPQIDTKFLNIKFPSEAMPWPGKGLRRASINSFGFGGTNSHVVLDDALHYLELHNISGYHNTLTLSPQQPISQESDETCLPEPCKSSNAWAEDTSTASSSFSPQLFVLSAMDKLALQRMIIQYDKHLASKPHPKRSMDSYLSSLAYTLASRRSRFPWRSTQASSSR